MHFNVLHLKDGLEEKTNRIPSQMNVAPCCQSRIGIGMGAITEIRMGWDGSLGGVRYRAPYGANNKLCICGILLLLT